MSDLKEKLRDIFLVGSKQSGAFLEDATTLDILQWKRVITK